MSTVTRPRGRHPAQVYWVRRSAVLVTAVLLVVAFARLLGGGGGDGQDVTGQVVGTTTTPAPSTPAGPAGPVGVTTTVPAGQPTGTPPPARPAQPDGPCSPEDITVTPVVASAPAGAPVRIEMHLTGIQPACTFTVSSKTLAVRITRKDTRVWTSQQCPQSIVTRALVVRSASPIPIKVNWSGRKSDATCSLATPWAMPGNYDVTAAVIGSEPTTKRFGLVTPPRPIVTKTVTVRPKPKASATQKPTAQPG